MIFILLFFINLININYALVCPIYLPQKINSAENYLIKTCQSNCTFSNVLENQDACLGVYYNYSGNIFIKQLSTIQSDEQCLKSKQCILEMDAVNSQAFSCCCSTNNCTLNWTILLTTPTTTYRSILIDHTTKTNVVIIDEEYFSWKLFLIIFSCTLFIILITFIFSLWKSLRNRHENKANTSFRKSSSSSSLTTTTLIEQLFFSAQKIISGKNSIVYKGIFNNDIVALKVYQQTDLLIWKNEVTLLKSIKHESIIKILSDGQYNSHLYLILPYYENGTLQSYLREPNRTLTINQCLIFLRSLASALSYLHVGQNKNHMTIVHRDIKSTNILIFKNELNLCLADFGIAIALPQVLTEKDFVQIGTMRYMAPELLEGVIAYTHDALYSVDMYALGLVMWEIVRQCDVYPITVYQAPYEEYITNNPGGSSFAAQIYDIVIVRRLRPTLIRQVKDKQHAMIILELCSLIDSCWTADSDMRMKAQTLAFKLNQLI
ncbi:unnamed protein product [Adineta steineri]|uniref:Serine/threonine-protein kinase receptor n=1 Tax=Adineta steineri TaxID=433720 RepID=A0A819CCE7_9BILA|nr:unnamed protein product [Adineta steineri]CAF3810202.1 unnamed protein product [Adineta steineri]